ncbi:MAG: polysaccharide biosynthesis protein, partial [Paracoccaceae bacterium]
LGPAAERFIGGTVLLTGGVAAVIVVFAEHIVATLFNPAYLAAAVVTYAMAVRGVVAIGPMILEPVLATQDRTGQIMRFNLIWAVITVISVVLAAPYGLGVLAWSQAGVTAASTLWAIRLMQREANVGVAGTLRAMCVAGAVVGGYGCVLGFSWPVIAGFVNLGAPATLAVGLGWAVLLSLPTLGVGRAVKVFSLRIFSK